MELWLLLCSRNGPNCRSFAPTCFHAITATIPCSDFPACFPWNFVLLIAMVTFTGQTGISQVTRYILVRMSHRRHRRSETAFLCMNRALAIGCLSLRICSPYRLFVLYHRFITTFAKRTKALPPFNILA